MARANGDTTAAVISSVNSVNKTVAYLLKKLQSDLYLEQAAGRYITTVDAVDEMLYIRHVIEPPHGGVVPKAPPVWNSSVS